jgi:TolB protein
MPKLFRLLLLVALVAVPAAFAQRKIGEVTVNVDKDKLPVHISATTPELEALALTAFGAHGRYKLVASGGAFDIKFSSAGANQVRVEIAKGLSVTPVASETVSGTSLRHALLRAADLAVEKTNGLGLKGFFTARLAFIRDLGRAREICTSDLFFSPGEVKQLTHNNALALSPRWAPNGTKLLFTSFLKSGFPDIYQLDLASNQMTSFVSFRGTNSGARFSPNGAQVAMVLSGEGQSEIYVGNAQGRQIARRTRSDAVKSSPCFSPDGSRIVFAQELGSNPQLYVMPAGGGTPQRLTTGFSYAAEPDWSRANPNKIACTVKTGGRYQIAVYDLAKGSAEVVSKADFDGIEPSWLADGRHLIYTARDRTTSALSVLDTETGQSKRVSATSLGTTLEASVWTP